MNISYVKTAGGSSVGGQKKDGANFTDIGNPGQLIEGLISKISDKITININGREIKVGLDSIKNPIEGEIRKFEILDVSKKGMLLREVGNKESAEKSRGFLCTTVETDVSSFEEIKKKKESLVNEEAIRETQAQLDNIKDRMTGEDCEELEKEGMSLEKYESERLERAILRIKQQRKAKSEILERQTESKKEYQEQIEETGKENALGRIQERYKTIITNKLEDAGLPATEENIAKISQALEKAKTAGQLTDKAVAYLIDKQLSASIENVYHAQYAGSGEKYADYVPTYQSYQTSFASYTTAYETIHSNNDEKAWEAVSDQAEGIIKDAGMTVNAENMDAAKWLFSKELPISKETLYSFQQLLQIKNTVKEKWPEKEIGLIEEIVKTFAGGDTPESTNLEKLLSNDSKVISEFMKQVNELAQRLSELTEQDIAQITARRQLEEIRLRMTSEAGSKLLSQGIHLDISELEQVVEGLRKLEREYYQKLLKEAHVPETDENISLLKETTDKMRDLKESPIFTLSVVLKSFQLQTVESLHSTGTSLKVRMSKAGETYETLMTKPREDMGDSIEKAFRSVDHLLKEAGLKVTEANRRAVKILGYNSMEITQENIAQVKNYDAQVNQLFHNLHPAVTVQLVKEGINPLNTPIKELNEKIKALKEKIGTTEDEKFSTFLYKLEVQGKNNQDGGLTKEERKAFIGIYRLMHQIEVSKGEAVGAVLESGRELTLNNLLSAVRTKKAGGFDRQVDDNLGILEKITTKKETITDQISYMTNVLEDIKEELSPDKLKEIMPDADILKGMEMLKNENIEVLREQLMAAEGSKQLERQYGEEKVEELRDLIKNSEAGILFLNNYSQPVTLENLIAANQLLDGGKQLYKQIKQKAEEWEREKDSSAETGKKINQILNAMSEDVDEPERLKKDFNDLDNHLKNAIEKDCEKPQITTDRLKLLQIMSKGMALAKNLSHQENYQIPIIVGNSVTSMNLTILSGVREKGKVSIQMESEKLGKINIELTVKENEVKGYISCQTENGYEGLTKEREVLKEALKQDGFDLKQLDYGMDSKWINRSAKAAGQEVKTDTHSLYQVAKAMVKTIKKAELD